MSLNDFEFGKFLGKGAFGSVAIVTRKKDHQIYAMKRVNIGKLPRNEVEAALNEVRILASLNHPNIVGYKEAFYDEPSKTLNIVMELANDGDIAHKIQENAKKRLRFDESTIWEWIIQLLEGLKYLHDNHIMHRDLKSANIFLMKNGLLKIGDLNVSKLAKNDFAKTKTGTPYYLAPEVWQDLPYDYKCDIWSVGCIIYELCCFTPPFRGTSLRELYTNVISGIYIPIPNSYSNDLKNLISKMLVVDPHKRISTNELLNSSIIQNKIKNSKNKGIIEKVQKKQQNANFIKTIKVPMNMKDINKALPKRKYTAREEMEKNDAFETLRKSKLPQISEKEPVNNYNKDLAKKKQDQSKNQNNKNYANVVKINNNDNKKNYNNNNNNYNNFNNIVEKGYGYNAGGGIYNNNQNVVGSNVNKQPYPNPNVNNSNYNNKNVIGSNVSNNQKNSVSSNNQNPQERLEYTKKFNEIKQQFSHNQHSKQIPKNKQQNKIPPPSSQRNNNNINANKININNNGPRRPSSKNNNRNINMNYIVNNEKRHGSRGGSRRGERNENYNVVINENGHNRNYYFPVNAEGSKKIKVVYGKINNNDYKQNYQENYQVYYNNGGNYNYNYQQYKYEIREYKREREPMDRVSRAPRK